MKSWSREEDPKPLECAVSNCKDKEETKGILDQRFLKQVEKFLNEFLFKVYLEWIRIWQVDPSLWVWNQDTREGSNRLFQRHEGRMGTKIKRNQRQLQICKSSVLILTHFNFV